MIINFLLGKPINEENELKLAEIAANLDANKFSCTFSIINGCAMFDCTPYNKKDWKRKEFQIYAAEIIISKLAKCVK